MKQKHLVGKELFIIQQLYDEWLVIVRQPDTSPFVGDDETLYEIRVVVRPNEIPDTRMTIFNHYEHSVIFADPYYRNVAEALAAACPYVHEVIESDMRSVLVILRLDADTAEKLAFDAETLKYMRDNPDAVIEVNMYPEIRYASFAAGRKDELPNMAHDDLDYDSLIHDLLELQLSSRSS